MIFTLASIIIVLLLVVVSIVISNKIITKKNQIEQAFGSIDVYLLKRFDLLPNLLSVLKKYMAHEKEILLMVTEMRSQTQKAGNVEEQVKISEKINRVMSGINVNLEAYPNLKADKQFIKLQFTLTELEEQLSAARRAYNAGVVEYNIFIQKFPNSLVAQLRGDNSFKVLETPDFQRQNIDLSKI